MNTERRIFCQLVNAGAFPLSGLGFRLAGGRTFSCFAKKK